MGLAYVNFGLFCLLSELGDLVTYRQHHGYGEGELDGEN